MRRTLYARIAVLLMFLFSLMAPVATPAMAQNGGLAGSDAYVSPQFGYTVTWDADWRTRSRDVISNPGGYDTLTLRGDLGTLLIQGQGDTETAASAVERRSAIEGNPDDVVAQDLESDIPTTEMLVGRNKVLIEGYTLEDSDAVVVIVLSARERTFDEALASVHEQVRFNDAPILMGADIAGIDDEAGNADPVDEPTETATEGVADEPEGMDEDATAAPVEGTPDDDPAGQIPDGEGEGAPAESAIRNGIFSSLLYDYSLEIDEDIWTVEDEFLSGSSDGLVLTNDLGTLTIWSWDAYEADAAACLAGESGYYASEDPTVSGWMPAEDARGNPIGDEGEGYAWGVFTLTYTNDAGEDVELVDYIECREIPGDDAVVIIFASAAPDLYNDHLDQVLDVADTIEIEGEAMVSGSTGTDDPVEPEQVESGLSGSLFTSPGFGFTVDIPAQWQIENEWLTADDEELVLSNGVSDISLWATTGYTGDDLAGCVDFAAEASGLDLEIDLDGNGEPFRAEGRREAYAHFRYTTSDGEDMMFFVQCQFIVRGESVLILAQDVPYDQFASQRKFRTELQDAIVMP